MSVILKALIPLPYKVVPRARQVQEEVLATRQLARDTPTRNRLLPINSRKAKEPVQLLDRRALRKHTEGVYQREADAVEVLAHWARLIREPVAPVLAHEEL